MTFVRVVGYIGLLVYVSLNALIVLRQHISISILTHMPTTLLLSSYNGCPVITPTIKVVRR